jgi:hypothetical protein
MKKRYFIFLLAFFLMLFAFAACKKAEKNGIPIIDDKGTTRVLATNDSGETMTDDAGNLIIVVTDNAGNAETQRVAPPDYYQYGDTIETPKYSLTIPKGWEKTGSGKDVRLSHPATNSELNLVTMDGKTYEDALDSAEQVAELFKAEGTVETTDAVICGVDAIKYSMTKPDAGNAVFYIFEKNATVYSFYSVILKENEDSIDAEAIFNSIVFK